MADRTVLRAANPWWQSAELIDDDAKIKALKAARITYDPKLRRQIEFIFEPDNTVVYTLRGSRQVGKTTLIKLQIRDFLESGTNPWNIFYYSFDLAGTAQEVAGVVDAYLEMSNGYRDEQERTCIFLDEITSVENWQRAVKFLVDASMLRHCTILAAGSQANSILRATERLPGRRGQVDGSYDKLLQPMSFSEFARMRSNEFAEFVKGRNMPAGNSAEMLASIAAGHVPELVYDLNAGLVDVLNRCLDEYMITGGIPGVVNERADRNFVSDITYKSHLDGIKADWGLHSTDMVEQLGSALAGNMGSSVSWSSLLRQTDFGSWATIQKHAYLLNDASVIHMFHMFGEEKKQARFRKEKKIYFTDMFYYHIFNNLHAAEDWFFASERFLADETNAGRAAECVAADHLARLMYDSAGNKISYDRNRHLFYWRNDRGREVDFVLYRGDHLELPVEIKYRNRIYHRELGGLTGFLDATGSRSGLVLSKDTVEVRRDYAVIPLAVFLALV